MLYACSGSVCKIEGGTTYMRHVVFFVKAQSRNEALGKAVLLTLEAYPKDDGWSHHDTVVTRDNEQPVEPGTNSIFINN